MDAIIEKLKKVKALADAGIGGEKTAAQARLKKMLKKHNLTLADLEQPTTTTYRIDCRPEQIKLAIQIVFAVTGKNPQADATGVNVDTSPNLWPEIQGMFAHYWREYKAMQDAMFMAFATVNGLFPRQTFTVTPVEPQQATAYEPAEAAPADPEPTEAPPTDYEVAVKQHVEQNLLRIIPPKPYRRPLDY